MKKYIEPATHMMAIVYGNSLMISLGEGDSPGNADAPLRQFSGETQSIKIMYI